jgi:hypothetical protein
MVLYCKTNAVARRAEDLGKREKAFMVWLGVSQQCILHFIVPIKAFRPKFDSEPTKEFINMNRNMYINSYSEIQRI